MMDGETVIKAMKAVLCCEDIGQAAAIFAVQAIAREFEYEFYEQREKEQGQETNALERVKE